MPSGRSSPGGSSFFTIGIESFSSLLHLVQLVIVYSRTRKKIDAGLHFLLSQFFVHCAALEKFREVFLVFNVLNYKVTVE